MNITRCDVLYYEAVHAFVGSTIVHSANVDVHEYTTLNSPTCFYFMNMAITSALSIPERKIATPWEFTQIKLYITNQSAKMYMFSPIAQI
jgi:hypothetical protein